MGAPWSAWSWIATRQKLGPTGSPRVNASPADKGDEIMRGALSIHDFLRDARVAYTVLPHRPAFTAQEDAATMHVPGRDWAKVVVCIVDGEPVQAVLPAPTIVDLARLLELVGGSEIRLAREEELERLFPDCEPGAMPPFGPLYGQLVFADLSLANEPDIVFNGGSHTEAIRMRWADYAASVRPIVGRFAVAPAA
jgi:Ala-tRNA(Pro) deacylase